MGLQWLHITCFVLLIQLSFEATSTQSGTGKRGITFFKKPARRRPGFFGLITQFVRETIQDTSFAVRNITDTVNAEFPRTAPPAGQNSTSSSGATRLTISQVNDILGRNYRSLVRLFNSEFRIALADSQNNIKEYKKEFRDAVRPYFTEGAWSTTTTERTAVQTSG
ncbi:uncharacterized protein [Halyomorpha halys]|uniref:uncharacterized protein n=1 Tax=Halyomorpha halys TaxID=286706 RepID=UPI0006D4D37C|nr:uncharacterized protein LOC106678186 [Halyomorpha halys]